MNNKLDYIIYEYSDHHILIEEFVYDGNKLSKVLYKSDNEVVFENNFTKASDYFDVSTIFFNKRFILGSGKVENIITNYTSDETSSETLNFEYDGDYTRMFNDEFSTNCYKGICFFDELMNTMTTSPKCIDESNEKYYEYVEGDSMKIRIFGRDSSLGFFEREVSLNPKNLNSKKQIEIPSNANMSLFLELNGVPSMPVNFVSGNNFVKNISELLEKPKSCNSSQVSFSGFSLENCNFYSNNLDRLSRCIYGSLYMFDISKSELNEFILSLETTEEILEKINEYYGSYSP